MASLVACVPLSASSLNTSKASSFSYSGLRKGASSSSSLSLSLKVGRRRRGPRVVCAVGDVSPDGTAFLIAGAIAVALVGTAYPIIFSRKDLCPECDGAGFIRSGSALAANAARKDQKQIVCPRCKGLGKLGQTDK